MRQPTLHLRANANSLVSSVRTAIACLGLLAQPLLLPSGNIIGTAVEGPAVGYEGSIWEYVP